MKEIIEKFKSIDKEFRDIYGYGYNEVKKIGIEKFAKKMGWEKAEDMHCYDTWHVVICPECKKDFGVFEDPKSHGLCDECIKFFDVSNLDIDSKMMFMSFDEFRDLFRRRTEPELMSAMAKQKFRGMLTSSYLDKLVGKSETLEDLEESLDDLIDRFLATSREKDISKIKGIIMKDLDKAVEWKATARNRVGNLIN